MSAIAPVILLAEDDPNDVFFMQRAFAKAGASLPLQVVGNGRETVEYLSGTGKFADRSEFPLPSLVLLDLKLPYMSGFDVLMWIRMQPSIKDIAVIVLTSSSEERDQQMAAELGAKAYFVKPPSREVVGEIMALLGGIKENAATPA